MTSLWWWALPVVLLPVWWHRQRRRQVAAAPLATARFLPRAAPRQLRAWRWVDVLLLLLRCLLLATLIAWLADPVVAWRGDTVLVVPGGASLEQNAIEVPTNDAIGWLRAREAEWKPEARITVVGPHMMAATRPHLRHQVELKTSTPPVAVQVRHVTIVSDNPAPWRAMFEALDGTVRYVVDAAPGATVFNPGRAAPHDAAAARMVFESWQGVHYAPAPYVAPPQVLAADPSAPLQRQGGALRDKLLMALAALFALERGLAHVRKR
jgi:hypothetical protein